MALRPAAAFNVLFWVALILFLFVIFSQSGVVLPANYKLLYPMTEAQLVSQRLERSERSWADSVLMRHQMRAQHATPDKIPFFPMDFNTAPYVVWDFFPSTWSCPWDIQRIGRLGDGGKWVCGMSRYEEREDNATIIYSFGVNDESTFEAEMLQRTNAEVFAYDYSVDDFGPQLAPAYRSRAHFQKVGLSGEDNINRNPPFHTIKTLMDQNNHTYMDMLKIDIEGAEYDVLTRLMDDFEGSTLPIGQIMIEIHLQAEDSQYGWKGFFDWWERLESFGIRPTWMEINTQAITIPDKQTNPTCTEYVWVNARDPNSILLRDS
ncbi:MAG: hypothetical protein M1817_004645 [Caeruleum heppii]|nr:MAG: hypothetical protein M1817_004645 [Caeruleum heppii]